MEDEEVLEQEQNRNWECDLGKLFWNETADERDWLIKYYCHWALRDGQASYKDKAAIRKKIHEKLVAEGHMGRRHVKAGEPETEKMRLYNDSDWFWKNAGDERRRLMWDYLIDAEIRTYMQEKALLAWPEAQSEFSRTCAPFALRSVHSKWLWIALGVVVLLFLAKGK